MLVRLKPKQSANQNPIDNICGTWFSLRFWITEVHGILLAQKQYLQGWNPWSTLNIASASAFLTLGHVKGWLEAFDGKPMGVLHENYGS